MPKGRQGFTTGACAAAAAKAAVLALLGRDLPQKRVEIPFPNGERHCLPVARVYRQDPGAAAEVVKDAGDDPDITHRATVVASVQWVDGEEIVFKAGEGVGRVTKPGLSLLPGEPAINPVPRHMIREALREVTERSLQVTLSIPGGRKLAQKTFNPRLGIENGLSILGTSGRVRPFSCPAMRCALKCALDVARACGVTKPVLVPGHIGSQAARKHLTLADEQVIEVGNEWGFVLSLLSRYDFKKFLVLGHPGKLAKLSQGYWNTHSSRSGSAREITARLARTVLGHAPPQGPTSEGLFSSLKEPEQRQLADALAAAVARAIKTRYPAFTDQAVVLINMQGDFLGKEGDLSPWPAQCKK